MNRRYPECPLVGVGAVVFRGDRVLLVRRGAEPAYGKWSLPGGLVELGESLEEAVCREVAEESGLEVKIVDLVAALDRVIPDASGTVEYHYILLDFLCEAKEGEPLAASDALDCRFVPLHELSGYSLTAGAQEVIRRALDRAGGEACPIYVPSL